MTSKGLSYLVGLPLLGGAVLYYMGDRMPDCAGLRVLFTGATVFFAKIECGLDAVGAGFSPNTAPTTYTFKPGIQCSWQPADKYYQMNPPLKTNSDGSYFVNFTNARLAVESNGNARLSDMNGNTTQKGNCHHVGGL
jgi:hypothetical protein